MIRLVLFLVLLAALAFGASWLADRPGEIQLVWEGWQVQTTLPVALVVIALVTGVLLLLWRLVALLVDTPHLVARFSRRRKREKGWSAVTRGLLAIGTGDAAAARKARTEAARLLPNEPLTHLLTAQTAQFEGQHEVAIAAFQAMLEKPETRLLGLRGLNMEARKAGDLKAAAAIAEEAAQLAPTLAWAVEGTIEARCASGDFAGARSVLERQMAKRGIDKSQYRRRRAVLLTAEAVALEHVDPTVARECAVEAVRLAPTLVPAAACAGRLLGAAGEMRKAARIVETAFAANPHPELADVEAYLRPGDAALDRLKRIRALVAKAPDDRESAIALAHAAIDAQDFSAAREALEPLLAEPTQRVCLLMAELEAAEHADIGKAREWTARAVNAARDPAWIADGIVSDHWAPISPVTGKLDAFIWAVPPGVAATPILEHEAERVKAAIAAVPATAVTESAAPAMPAEGAEASGTGPIIDADTGAKPVPPAPEKDGGETVPAADALKAPAAEEAPKPAPETAAAESPVAPAQSPASAAPEPPSAPQAASQPSTASRPVTLSASARPAEAIVPLPHLPDDPGPGPEEPETVEDKRRFFGL